MLPIVVITGLLALGHFGGARAGGTGGGGRAGRTGRGTGGGGNGAGGAALSRGSRCTVVGFLVASISTVNRSIAATACHVESYFDAQIGIILMQPIGIIFDADAQAMDVCRN